ncbi:MAG: UrcA family protein [Erythrobacter sp.]
MLLRLALSAVTLACAAPALAEQTSIAVPYSDLDLTSEAGRKTLDTRLARAARWVCGGSAPIRGLAQRAAVNQCLAEARASYAPQVELALNAANARRVAVLADKIALFSRF